MDVVGVPADVPSTSLGTMDEGATVVLLAYSGGCGVDPEGKVLPSDALFDVPLRPLAFVGRVDDAREGEVTILAGTATRSGASGGAILDLEGRLVGIVTGSLVTTRAGTVETWKEGAPRPPGIPGRGPTVEFEVRQLVRGTPAAVFRDFVLGRRER